MFTIFYYLIIIKTIVHNRLLRLKRGLKYTLSLAKIRIAENKQKLKYKLNQTISNNTL